MPQQRQSGQLDPELAEKINEHVSLEARSAFAYFSMASWAEVRGLTGFAEWFRAEAAGEFSHMQQFVAHLNDRGYQATFGALPAPGSNWETVQDVFETVVELEHKLCAEIDSLISMVGQRSVSAPEDVVREVAAAAAEKRPTVLLLVEVDGEKSFVPVRFAA